MRPGRRPLFLSPARWPIRWRLAGVSAGLTFAILLIFAAGVGRMVENRLRGDFRDELEATARQIALGVSVAQSPDVNERIRAGEFLKGLFPFDPGEELRFVDASNQTLPGSTPDAPVVEPVPGFAQLGEVYMATQSVPTTAFGVEVFVQYSSDHASLDATIDRLWLFLGIGVGGGALLATLAGLWIGGRAMRPIAGLTATAREIATTRDPSLSMPEPVAEDEIAELARTLDSMLSELDAARTESQQVVQAQREFIADASHELRTPLTSILANLELLHDRLEAERPDGEENEMVESALRSSRRMRRLVADLLMLARADAGRFGERRACDLVEIAEHAIAEVRPVADGHRLELQADAPVPITGNADELHRLTVNLIDNALRHTPPGTTVDINVARRDGHAVLEVADDGPGLPPGLEEQVFARFVRGSGPADLAVDSGTGLGLAIVRAVAGSHGGQVAAGSSKAGGALFRVTLPAASEPAEAPRKVSADV